jgi:hypothetical protein|tara:strand:+ start:2102 stop:2701 length:600 start_codon:yes stop_codon:yes gene_type:complete
MANNLKSFVTIKGNDESIKLIDSMVDNVNNNDSDSSVAAFAMAFYNDVELTEDRGVLNTWSNENLGSKWTKLCDVQNDGEFSIESAWYPPKQFFIHLYNLCVELDENVEIEVTYEDETYSPIGAIVIKKDRDGTPCMWEEEDNDIENPLEDMDWDDEKYDEVSEEFYESLYENQQSLLGLCHELVVTDGEPILEQEEIE